MNQITQLAAVIALIVAAGNLQAAVISWDTPGDIAGDGDVSTNGSLVGAYNFGGIADTTVNGVLFKGMAIGSPQVVSVSIDGLHTLAINPERAEHTLRNFTTGSAVSGTDYSGLTSEYRTLLDSSAGSNFADRENLLTLGGLILGQAYEFQAWFNDSGTEGQFAYGLFIDGEELYPSTQMDSNNAFILGGTGQYVVGNFVADAATQEIVYLRSEVGGGINGFQLRAISPAVGVPEPGVLALMGLAGFGMGLVRRRSKNTRS